VPEGCALPAIVGNEANSPTGLSFVSTERHGELGLRHPLRRDAERDHLAVASRRRLRAPSTRIEGEGLAVAQDRVPRGIDEVELLVRRRDARREEWRLHAPCDDELADSCRALA
jgi:hypothetical protein